MPLLFIQFDIMEKRQLPQRSTRGQKPVNTLEQQDHDDLLYQGIFGDNLDDEEEYVQDRTKQQIEQIRKQMAKSNYKNYPYCRAHHYYFCVDQFPRAEGQYSYAIDMDNVLKSTFSQENLSIGPSKLYQVINRTYFCLAPRYPYPHENKQQRCKNICHEYLFDLQDEKYLEDSKIYTLKMLYKKLDVLLETNKIRDFNVLKEDIELKILSDRQVDIVRKVNILQKKIHVLEERRDCKKNMRYDEDRAFYHHSLNQAIHQNVDNLKRQISRQMQFERIGDVIFANEFQLNRMISTKEGNLNELLRKIFRYYNSVNSVIDDDSIRLIQQIYANKEVSQQRNISFPVQIYWFGSNNLVSTVNQAIAYKLLHRSQQTFYSAKFVWKKLFGVDLVPYKQKNRYSQKWKQKLVYVVLQQAKSFYDQYRKSASQRSQIQYPLIDDLLNLEGVKSSNSHTLIFNVKEMVRISGRQFLVLMLYSWICRSFNELMPFILFIQSSFMDFFILESFHKYIQGLVDATGKAIVGVLNIAIQMLFQVLNKSDPFQQMNIQLFFQSLKNNVGIVWRMQNEQVWETQSQHSGSGEREEDSSSKKRQLEDQKQIDDDELGDQGPVKRVKQNQNQD